MSETITVEIAKEFEKRDEDQIMAEMRGELVQSWVYSFEQYGRKVTNLSYAGVKEAIRRRGNFDIVPCPCCNTRVHVKETDEEIRAIVTVWDLNANVKVIGAASSFKKQPFAWVLAVNKAERNAFRKLLPEKQIALLIKQWLEPEDKKPVLSGKLA